MDRPGSRRSAPPLTVDTGPGRDPTWSGPDRQTDPGVQAYESAGVQRCFTADRRHEDGDELGPEERGGTQMPSVQLQHPRDNEPIPAGVPFAVAGLALGTGGAEQHLVETVTVAVDSGQPLAAKTKAVPKQRRRVAYCELSRSDSMLPTHRCSNERSEPAGLLSTSSTCYGFRSSRTGD